MSDNAWSIDPSHEAMRPYKEWWPPTADKPDGVSWGRCAAKLTGHQCELRNNHPSDVPHVTHAVTKAGTPRPNPFRW